MAVDKPQSGGYIKVHRKIWSDPDFEGSRYSYRDAFLYLVSEARFADGIVTYRGRQQKICRGSYITSQSKLASKWHWGRNTVARTLNRWAKTGKITYRGDYTYTVITILNYEKYQ